MALRTRANCASAQHPQLPFPLYNYLETSPPSSLLLPPCPQIHMNEQFLPLHLEMRGKALGLDFTSFDHTALASTQVGGGKGEGEGVGWGGGKAV